jgi:hypothetical protein
VAAEAGRALAGLLMPRHVEGNAGQARSSDQVLREWRA